jgi:glycosyltransferase involved in cell wall biosynthesis
LLAVRNEELYLERCLRHLAAQGIQTCVIDNQSTDRTRQIAEAFLGKGVCQIEDNAYLGYFDLLGMLRTKERLAATIDADWFIHHDADEIREAPAPFKTLREAISAADANGYNAVNFDEFVFVPSALIESFERTDYVERMKSYYLFAPHKLRRINAWKRTRAKVNLTEKRGHQVEFAGRRISPEHLILRHYIFLSADHAVKKYGQRIYSKYEMEVLGWRRQNRRDWGKGALVLPPPTALRTLARATDPLDRSEPRRVHLFSFDGQKA